MENIKAKALILNLMVLILIIIGCGIGNQQIISKEGQTNGPQITKHYKNKEFQVGNQSLLISDIITTQKIERTSYITKQTNNLFLVMRIRITNNGRQTLYYEPNLFKIKDSAGHVFPCSDESDFYLNYHSYFFFKPVSPDETKIGDVFFEIPLNAKELIFEASNSLEDYDQENVKINLDPI